MSLLIVLQSMRFYTDVTSVTYDSDGDGEPDAPISINQLSQSEVLDGAIKLEANEIGRILQWTSRLFATGDASVICSPSAPMAQIRG